MESRSIYFIGIGGIGMSALARWHAAQGWRVAGYDRTATAMTQALADEGMHIYTGLEHDSNEQSEVTDLSDAFPQDLIASSVPWQVVRTPAVALDHPICKWFTARDIPMLKRSEVLGLLTAKRPTLAVAGTHGKTTTSAVLAHMLTHAGLPCDAFLGGLIEPFGERTQPTNLLLAEGLDRTNGKPPWTVVEADEFDRSFLTLHPEASVITSIDADHLDVYGDADTMHEAFRVFSGQVSKGGLYLHVDVAMELAQVGPNKGAPTYGWSGVGNPTYGLADFEVAEGRTRFTIALPGGVRQVIESPMPGKHNAENVQAAALLAHHAGVQASEIAEAMACFPGVSRRFQVHALRSGHIIVNDYAHHPVELRRTIEAARHQFPGRKISGIFQPHLYSRTRDFAAEFGQALSALDRCWLAPVFPAREAPIAGVDSHLILDNIEGIPAETSNVSTFLLLLEPMSEEVILVLGAGDIDRMIPDLIQRLEGLNES